MRRWRLWRRVKRALGLAPPEPPAGEPPDHAAALVPVGPPRRPLGSSGVALELPEEPEDTDARGREASLELADDGLDVVAVGIEQERGVVQAGVVRAVLLAHAGRSVVLPAGFQPGAVKRVDLRAGSGDERDVDRASGSPSTTTRLANWAPRSFSQSGGISSCASTAR